MPSCKIIRYRVSYWTKGYNKGKINVVLEADTGQSMLIENLTADQGSFLLNLLAGPGKVSCDPDTSEGLLFLNRSVEVT